MITKIRLKNWKSHEDSELEFAAGTNGLVGIVGSGKTSILDAICFAFFGTFPTLQTRKLKLEDVIMKKPTTKDMAEVEVLFTLNGNNYSVKRVIEKNRGTSYSEIKENGRTLESPGTKNVTAIVENKLKVNYELFSKAIYSEQNAIDYFLTLGKGQRMKKIDELLMIDRFEKARANAVTLTNKIADTKIGKESAIGQINLAEIQLAITELKKSISELENEKVGLKKEMEIISKNKSDAEKEAAELRNIRENLEKLMRDDKGLESTIVATLDMIDSVEKSLKELGEEVDISSIDDIVENQSKKIEEMSDFLKNKQADYERMHSELASSKTNIEFLQKEKIEKLQMEFDEKLKIKEEFEHLRDRTGENVIEQINGGHTALQKLIGEMEAARVKISELEEQLEKIADVEGVCPLCGTSLSEERKKMILSDKQRELDSLKEKIEKARIDKAATEEKIKQLEEAAKKLDEMFKEISDLDEIMSDLEKSRHMLAHHTQSIELLSKQLDSLKQEMEIVKKEMDSTTSAKQRFEIISGQIKDYEQQKQRIEQLKKEREQITINIAQLESRLAVTKLEEVEQLLRKLIAEEKEKEMKIVSSDQMIKERGSRLEEYGKSLATVEKEKKEIERLEKLIKDLKIFIEALKDTQAKLREEFIEAVNYTMNKLWQTLYPYQDFIGIRLAIEEGDYVLQLQERTTAWVNVEGAASGGERSIACLALRIAFALVLAPHLRWLVLDEPTHNLDTKAVEDLAETLRERITDIVDQVFLITHEELLESAITGNLYRLERDKSKDEATKVVQMN